MSYTLENDEPVQTGVRRIAHEQVEGALASLETATRDPGAADRGIHDARKRFKKVRAVLRLVRKTLGGHAYGRENRAYRDAGRFLADVRESAVAVGTVRALRERRPLDVADGSLRAFVERLETRHRHVLDRALAPGGPFESAVSLAERAGSRIDTWPIEAGGFGAVGSSLRKVYRRGRDRMAEAYEDPSGPRFHEWRKRAKYLWYQLRILAPIWDTVLEPWSEAQHDLTGLLGEANDLTDLLQLLERRPDLHGEGRVPEVLGHAARARREELWAEARPLGLRLYAESPDSFVSRIGRYWSVARDPTAGPWPHGRAPEPDRTVLHAYT